MNEQMMIKSSGFDALGVLDRYFLLAEAYLDAAICQCEILAAKRSRQSFAKACVVLWLARHATELFYKGALHNATGNVPPPKRVPRKGKTVSVGGHNILFYEAMFREHFSEADFPFDAPAREILWGSDWSEENLAQALVLIGKRNERYRYPVDSAGKNFSDPHVITPANYLGTLKKARRDMRLCIRRINTASKRKAKLRVDHYSSPTVTGG